MGLFLFFHDSENIIIFDFMLMIDRIPDQIKVFLCDKILM